MKRRVQLATVFLLFLVFAAFATAAVRPYYQFLTQTLEVSATEAFLDPIELQQDDGRTNLLILGKPDTDREGADLTDSITMISYDHHSNSIVSIGIPRDIWSPTLQDKINSAYAYGEAKKDGGGITLANAEISALLDKPIHYTLVIQFSQFEQLIDTLGGIEVTIENGFSDPEFPIAGMENDECFGMDDYSCRYQTVSFEAGTQILDGERALQFVRSRHAEGSEGSDFSRSQRQQIVLGAIEERLMQEIQETDIDELNRLYQSLNKLVERTISNEEVVSFARTIATSGTPSRSTVTLPHELFTVPELWVYERYVLLPRGEMVFRSAIDCIYSSMQLDGCIPESGPEVALQEE